MLSQKLFRQRFLRLVTADGRVLLDVMESIQAAGIHNGDCLSAVALQAKVAATDGAFVRFCGDGKILAWGDPAAGGNSSKVQEQLQNIREVQATRFAFAAILEDGSVVMWGQAECNKYSGVQYQLRSVKEI